MSSIVLDAWEILNVSAPVGVFIVAGSICEIRKQRTNSVYRSSDEAARETKIAIECVNVFRCRRPARAGPGPVSRIFNHLVGQNASHVKREADGHYTQRGEAEYGNQFHVTQRP